MEDNFPKMLYITRAGEGEDSYLETNVEPDTAGDNDGDEVAVYELRAVKRLLIRRTLENV